jgi:outer membrane protein TolC
MGLGKQIEGPTVLSSKPVNLTDLFKNVDFSQLTNLTPFEISAYSAALNFSQPIYTFGKVGNALYAAKQFEKSAISSNNRNLQQLQLAGLDAFYQVMLSTISLNLTKRSFERKKELFEYLDRNFKLGAGNKAQLLSAKADMKSQAPSIIKAEEDLKSAQMFLNMAMGRSLTDVVDIDTGSTILGLLSMTIPAEKEALQGALSQREDIKSLEYMNEATLRVVKIYNAMYLPSIAATGSFGIQGTEPKELVDWSRRVWSIGVGMSWSFFDGFSNNAKSRQYRSDAQKLEIARDIVSKSIQIEITRALMECAGADSNKTAIDEAFGAAKESFDLTNDNFKQGQGQLTDVQLAEERLRQAEMGIVSAQYRLVRSRAALKLAMGNNIITLE